MWDAVCNRLRVRASPGKARAPAAAPVDVPLLEAQKCCGSRSPDSRLHDRAFNRSVFVHPAAVSVAIVPVRGGVFEKLAWAELWLDCFAKWRFE
jgi:hypothetical protein